MKGKWATIAILTIPVAVYGLGINPYVLPDTFDNLVYLHGARALVDTGRFTFGGWVVWDWPPGFSTLLAMPLVLGWDSVVAAKVVVVALVAAGVGLGYRLLEVEGHERPAFTCALAALAPYAVLQGTRVMSDWPF
ncbi:MAG: hypothetical protein KC416_13855, partial [Myxococcales bacterium]|nr:hypothetical protein [Myxococcales bacterium]